MAVVKLEFDWKNAPQANPEGMCVFFYPEEGGEPVRFDFTGKTGGEIDIKVGRYKVLCYNNDTEAVQFRGMEDFNAHEGIHATEMCLKVFMATLPIMRLLPKERKMNGWLSVRI